MDFFRLLSTTLSSAFTNVTTIVDYVTKSPSFKPTFDNSEPFNPEKSLEQCDYVHVVLLYSKLLNIIYGLEGSLYEALVKAHTMPGEKINEKTLNSLCANIKALARNKEGTLSAPDNIVEPLNSLSNAIKDALKESPELGKNIAKHGISLKEFFILHQKNFEYTKAVSVEDYLRAIYVFWSGYSIFLEQSETFGGILRAVTFEGAEHSKKCPSIDFKNPNSLQKELHKCVKEHIKALLSYLHAWSEKDFDIIIDDYLNPKGVFTNWEEVKKLASVIEKNILRDAYINFANKYGACLTKEDFNFMVVNKVLLITEEGEVKFDSQVSWHDFADSIVEHFLFITNIALQADQQAEVVERISLQGRLETVPELKNCHKDFEVFQSAVSTAIFTVVVRAHAEKYGMNKKQISQIEQPFLDLLTQNAENIKKGVITQIINNEFWDDWIATQAQKLGINQLSTEAFSEFLPVSSTELQTALAQGAAFKQKAENQVNLSLCVNYTNSGLSNNGIANRNELMIGSAIDGAAWSGTGFAIGSSLFGLGVGAGWLGYWLYQKYSGSPNEAAGYDVEAGHESRSLVGDKTPVSLET